MIVREGVRSMTVNDLVVTALSDQELLRRVTVLAGREREVTAELIAHLAEFDARKLYLGEGYGSLFSYCTDALRLSEHATFNRIEAARASRRLPIILDLLAAGSLNLSTVRLVAPHLTAENHGSLLAEAGGRSKREVELLVARIAPRPDVLPMVRRLPAPGPCNVGRTVPVREPELPQASATSPGNSPFGNSALGNSPEPASFPASPASTARPVVAPVAPERYRVQFTVGKETHDKLRRVQDLLRREIPNGDPGSIFDKALTLLLEDIARKKLGDSSTTRSRTGGNLLSRHVPAAVRRVVWLRDGGQCAFVARNGRRCRERAYLEFHHVRPFALGGETTPANLALRCRLHNAYEANFDFGRDVAWRGSKEGLHEPSVRGPM